MKTKFKIIEHRTYIDGILECTSFYPVYSNFIFAKFFRTFSWKKFSNNEKSACRFIEYLIENDPRYVENVEKRLNRLSLIISFNKFSHAKLFLDYIKSYDFEICSNSKTIYHDV